MLDLIIRNGLVVNEDSSRKEDIGIKDGKIVELGDFKDFPEASKVIDASNKFVMPGLIDSHVHIDMDNGRVLTTDSMENATISAAYGGTTSIVMFAIPIGDERPLEALEKTKKSAEGNCRINYSFHTCLTNMEEQSFKDIEEMIDMGYTSVKMFSIYKGALMLPTVGIHRVLDIISKKGGLALIHAENAPYVEAMIEEKIKECKTLPVDHMESRPPVSEVLEVAKLIQLVKYTGAPTIFVHMTTSMVRDLIANAKENNIPIYTELCPHYLSLTKEVYSRPNGQEFVCSPPMRSQEDVNLMWSMINEGLGDMVNSDHSAYTKAQKNEFKDYFPNMPNGLPGIETRCPVLFSEGVSKGKITENDFVRLCSSNTARLMGMYPEKGIIAVGADADIAIIDPEKEYTMTIDDLHMMTDYTPFEGIKMKGKFTDVIVGGKAVIENGEYTGVVNGKEIERHTSTFY